MSCFLIVIFVLVFSISTVSGMVYDGFFLFTTYYYCSTALSVCLLVLRAVVSGLLLTTSGGKITI